MSKGPNPTIAVHLTQKELHVLNRLIGFPAHLGELSNKIGKAMVDIRPIIRDARREAKQVPEQDLSVEIPPTTGRGGW
jgi:hypothetical protein